MDATASDVIIKIVSLFLIFMAVLAMFGRLRLPKSITRIAQKGALPPRPKKCRKCGAPRLGRGPCPCGED